MLRKRERLLLPVALALELAGYDFDVKLDPEEQYWYHVAKVRNVGTLRRRGNDFVAIVPLSSIEKDLFCPVRRHRYVSVLWINGSTRLKYHSDWVGQVNILERVLFLNGGKK